MTTPSVSRFVHLTDTHIGPLSTHEIRGRNTHETARALVAAINSAPHGATFVAHTGDITADPHDDSTAHAANILSELTLPRMLIPGNHDAPDHVRSLMEGADVEWRQVSEGRMPYVFKVKQHTFVALDAIPSEPYWGARLPQDQIDIVRDLIAQKIPSLTVLIHYPTMPVGVQWIDEKMLLWNGADLHRALKSAEPGVVKGVFSGHVHRPFAIIVDGILYSSSASAFEQFGALPAQAQESFMINEQPGYATVEISDSGTRVAHHRLSGEEQLP